MNNWQITEIQGVLYLLGKSMTGITINNLWMSEFEILLHTVLSNKTVSGILQRWHLLNYVHKKKFLIFF